MKFPSDETNCVESKHGFMERAGRRIGIMHGGGVASVRRYFWRTRNGPALGRKSGSVLFVLALLFALPSLPGAGSAAHAQVLVSSLEQTEGSAMLRLRPNVDNAQAFTTGPNGAGYTLTGVEIDLGQSAAMANAPFTVKIAEYSSNEPGDEVATLTAPASLGVGRRTRTFTHSGVQLDANTTYFVFLDSGGAGAGNFRTNAGGGDSGEEGWSVADGSRRYDASGETPGWRTVSAPLRMRVNGRVKALPALANFTVSEIAAQPTQLRVDWDAYSGAEKYRVRWKIGSDAFDSHELTETEYTITDLTTHEVYTVEVIAIDTGTTPNTHIAKSAGTGVPGAPTITFSAGDAVTEGTAATFTVTASFAPASDLEVNLFVWDAVSPSDFLASENEDAQTVTITSGQTTATLTIPTVDDSDDEPDGEIEVLPVEGTGYILGTTERVKVAVSDNDDAADTKPTVTFSGGDAVTEGTAIDFTVMVSSAPASDLEIFLGILDAPLPSRFIDPDAYPGGKWSVTITAGETSVTVSVPTIDDAIDEPDGEVWITVLTDASLGSAYEDAAGILKVLVSDNDDAPPTATLVLTPSSIGENGAASGVTATLDDPSSHETTLTVSAAPVPPAVAGDYTLSANRTLTIAAGETSSTGAVTITAVNNNVDAPDKTVTVSATVSSAQGIKPPASRTLTITDDDGNSGGGNPGGGNPGGGNPGGGNPGGGNPGGGNPGGGNPDGGNPGGGNPDGGIAPAAPALFRAVAGNASASLSWQTADDNGGPPVSHYAFQYSKKNEPFGPWTDIPESAPGEANANAYAVPDTLEGEMLYTFRLRAVNEEGTEGDFAVAAVFLPVSTNTEEGELPSEVALFGNYPNPFNPQTRIDYALPSAVHVRLAVYDVQGREVRILENGLRPAGRHTAVFDAAGLPGGVYVYRLETSERIVSKVATLVK